MAKQTFFPKGTAERLKTLIKQEKSAGVLRKMQAVYLGAIHTSTEEIIRITFYKKGYIRQLWTYYRQKGEKLFINKKTEIRSRSYLSKKEEKQFLKPFFGVANKAGILIVSDIHQALEKRIGHKVHLHTAYNLLHRHGWRKIVPRAYHPKRDSEKRKQWHASFPPGNTKG